VDSQSGEDGYGQAQIHRSLVVRPVLLGGGAERAPTSINATTLFGIGLGPSFTIRTSCLRFPG
jgi:hypothetical protein